MKISRENFEAYALDYYEGNLSKEGVEELFAFLVIHPDLQEVFDSFEHISFEPEGKFSFENKASLKKDVPQHSSGINETNCTAWFVSYVEGLLNEKEIAMVQAFAAANPAKAHELEVLKSTVLKADEVKFEMKDALKKAVVITSENFEEYAVLAMDGELDSRSLSDFNAYLSAHPASRTIYEALLATKVTPEKAIVFENKNALRKKEVAITAENFEAYAVLAMDEELNAGALATFNAYLNAHSASRSTYNALLATKLVADETIIFADKDALKRKDRKGFIWWREMSFAAAAVVALLFGLYFWTHQNSISDDGKEKGFATNNTSVPKQNSLDSNRTPVVEDHSNDQQVANANTPKKNIRNDQKDTDSHIVVPASTLIDAHPATFASRNSVQQLTSHSYTSVDFSDALYADQSFAKGQEPASISLQQYAMRWMKSKLDRRSSNETNDDQDSDLLAYAPTKTTGDVSGFDLTKSAVDRLAYATGAKMHLDKNSDETVLSVWKYDVVLSHN